MTEESFLLSIVGDVPVVSTPSDIDITNSAQLRAALLKAGGLGQVVVADLSRTEFCDSSGLNVLVRELRRAQADNRDLRLVVRTAPLERILTVTGMDTIFRIFPTLRDALGDHLDRSVIAINDGAFPDGDALSATPSADGSKQPSADGSKQPSADGSKQSVADSSAAWGWTITRHEP